VKFWLVGLACALAVTLALVGSSRTQAQAPAPNAASVDALWARIYPVFAHDRCSNCHGRVRSFAGFIYSVTPETHPGGDARGGDDPVVDCGDCHHQTEAIKKAWKFTAPESMEWADKSADVVCTIEAAQVRAWNEAAGGSEASRAGSWLHHLYTDPIIDSAWLGRAGGGRDEPEPGVKSDLPRPPLSKPEFLAAAAAWVNAGAPCRPTGSISQLESFSANYTTPFPIAADAKAAISTSGRREVLVVRNADGTAQADVRGSGHDRKVVTYTQPTERGVCHVTMIDTTDWTTIAPTGGKASITTRVEDGAYELNFVVPDVPAGPAVTVDVQDILKRVAQGDSLADVGKPLSDDKGDTTRMTSRHRLMSDCGLPAIDQTDEPVTVSWPVWQFTVRCPREIPPDGGTIRCDPREPGKKGTMTGQMIRRVFAVDDAADPQTWLGTSSPIGTGVVDMGNVFGKQKEIPVTVTTTWSLSLGQK
jgi:hypothetical protein